jgi:hypothetical protein
MTKERPISYSPLMVLARNAGIKTQTRRIIKNQPDEEWTPFGYDDLHAFDKHGELTERVNGWGPCSEDGLTGYNCPYGKPGDRLWVREAWRTHSLLDHLPPRELLRGHPIHYEVHEGPPVLGGVSRGKFRPPMFMCRWMSRGVDEITSVRAERLQDISRGDCMAEGCPLPNIAKKTDPKQWYADFWEKINGPGSWAANPWVWVLEFKVLKN